MKKLKIENHTTMKNRFKILAITLTLGFLFGLSTISFPQPPPPGGHGQGGNGTPGGSAPIGSGLFILLGLGATYGAKKVYHYKK